MEHNAVVETLIAWVSARAMSVPRDDMPQKDIAKVVMLAAQLGVPWMALSDDTRASVLSAWPAARDRMRQESRRSGYGR